MVGRATRVFLVKDVKSGEQFVLKDVWLAKGRQMEHEVRRELLDDVREKLGKREMKEVERHLFTPVEHCIVQVQVNGQVVNDDTDEVIMDMVEAHTSEHVNTRATKSNAKGITHYWIVYEEYATPLHEISWLSLVMMTLEGLVKGRGCLRL